jgi:hypothetical protein
MTRARTCGVVLGGILAAARPAAAAEDEWLVAADGGYTAARADGLWRHGGALGVQAQYGFTDAWSGGARLALGLHPVTGDAERPSGRLRATTLAAGVTYTVDVLRVVPFAGMGIALQNLAGAVRDARTDLGGEVSAGADYLLDRRWSLGLLLRYQILPLPIAGGRDVFGGTPAAFSLALRLGRGL